MDGQKALPPEPLCTISKTIKKKPSSTHTRFFLQNTFMLISSSRFAAAAVLVCLASLKHAAAAAPQLAWSNPVIKAIPKGKVAFGVNVDITHGRTDNIQSPADAQARFGQQLAIFGIFVVSSQPVK